MNLSIKRWFWGKSRYGVMLFEGLLGTNPFDGVLKSRNGKIIDKPERIAKSLTLFTNGAKWPKGSITPKALTNDLYQLFRQLFVNKVRGQFPRSVIEKLEWIDCPHCGTSNGRQKCPACGSVMPTPWSFETTEQVSLKFSIKKSLGAGILDYQMIEGVGETLQWNSGKLLRNGTAILDQVPREEISLAKLFGSHTLLVLKSAKDMGMLLTKDQTPISLTRLKKDSGGHYIIGVNSMELIVVTSDGVLAKIPKTTPNQSVILRQSCDPFLWTGSKFSLVLMRENEESELFVLKNGAAYLERALWIPRRIGKITGANCCFAVDGSCWLILTLKSDSKEIYVLTWIDSDGLPYDSICVESDQLPSWMKNLDLFFAGDGSLKAPYAQNLYTLSFISGELTIQSTYIPDEVWSVMAKAKCFYEDQSGDLLCIGSDEATVISLNSENHQDLEPLLRENFMASISSASADVDQQVSTIQATH